MNKEITPKLDSAKDVLMNAANDNPAATIVVSLVNGNGKFGSYFTNVNELLLLKWVVHYEIEKAIKKGFGLDQPVEQK